MDEGTFRILRALGDGRARPHTRLVSESGEAPSVLRRLQGDHPEWFEAAATGEIKASVRGLAALARELVARQPGVAASTPEEREVAARLRACGQRRGRVKRELDQVWATVETTLARARLLVERGDVQRGLAFLGDDDMTSLAIHLLGVSRRTTVLELDEDLLRLYDEEAAAHGWEHAGVAHDLREPIPRALAGRFGAVFTDPPYALEGFTLFVSRAVELLRPDGRLLVCCGQSRRATERGLQKQRVLCEAGFFVEEVLPGFNRYEGAQAIGATSALYVCLRTPQARALVRGRAEGALYTRRSPDPDGGAARGGSEGRAGSEEAGPEGEVG